MGDGARIQQRSPDGPLKYAQRLALETAFILPRSQSGLLQNLFGGEVAVRRVMLVQGMHRHPVGSRAGG